jgi:hypothetical protein
MRIWTPSDAAHAREIGGCLRRTTRLGGWRFRRRRRDGGYDDEYVPIWDETNVDVESCPIVPKSERVSQESLRSIEWDDIDQGSYPACCLAATCNAMEFLLAKLGRAKTKLDWYKSWLALSGGSGGVEIGVALSYAMSEGIPLADGSGRLVVTEAWDAASREAVASGLLRGCPVVFGHSSHAECALTYLTQGGVEYMDVRNSWGKTWNPSEAGWHRFEIQDVEMAYGAAILREVELRPVDTADLPDATG